MNRAVVDDHRSRRFLATHAWRSLAFFVVLSTATTHLVRGATLQDLFHGGSLNVGSSRFSDWQLISLDSTGGADPDLSLITVVPLGSELLHPGFQLNANGQLATSGINAINMTLKYRASTFAIGNTFTSHTVQLTSIDFTSSGGIGFISAELGTSGSGESASTAAIVDHESDFFQFANTATFSPTSQVFVTANVFITGLASGDGINLAMFTSRFAQIGPQTLLGDYNQNGAVDAADYTVWRNNLATTNPLPNDAIGGTIDVAQYNQWRGNFGQTPFMVSNTGTAAVVPEPATLAVLLLGLLALLSRRPARKWQTTTVGVNPPCRDTYFTEL